MPSSVPVRPRCGSRASASSPAAARSGLARWSMIVARATNVRDAPPTEHSKGHMTPDILRALRHGHAIDITTTGRQTGQPRRIEIVFHNLDGRIYISGIPNPLHQRAWLLNLEADPNITFHLKGPVKADLPA